MKAILIAGQNLRVALQHGKYACIGLLEKANRAKQEFSPAGETRAVAWSSQEDNATD